MKPFPCIESTVDVTHDNLTVRLWISRDDIPAHPQTAMIADVVSIVETALRRHLSYTDLMTFLVTIPALNAVQVMIHAPQPDRVVVGAVVYTVPFDDVHG